LADPLGPIDDIAYGRLRRLLVDRFGLEFSERRREVVRLHLRDHAVAAACISWGQYVDLLEGPGGPDELQRIIDAVTIHQTEFFRHRQLFEALRQQIIPQLAERARRDGRPLQIWSAGCSTGEEPYSLATIALESHIPVHVLATDLAPGVLEQARAGSYPRREATAIPPPLFSRYFATRGGVIEVGKELRKAVTFSQHNLAHDPPPIESCDLIMCCNVTIYFAQDAFLRAVDRLCGAVRPGGYLVLGHSESLWRIDHPLELVDLGGAFAYRRPVSAPPVPAEAAAAAGAPAIEPIERPRVEPRIERPRVERVKRPEAPPTPRQPPAAARLGREPAAAEVRPAARPVAAHPSRPVEVAELVAAAQGMFERDELEALERLIRGTLAVDPSLPELHLLLGMLRQRQGRPDDAVASFSRAIYCDATFSLAWFYRAAVLDERGELDKAAGDYSTAARCLARDPRHRWDQFLESMGHEALVRHCEERSANLGLVETGVR
jgi:chemotaxis protein methyltransferase CheR